jgi:hypothetical protein
MANMHKHPLRGIRGIEDRLWEDLDTYAKAAGSDRSNITRQLWEWFVDRPGAELPERPTAGAVLRQVTEGRPNVRRVLEQAVNGDLPERPVSSEETST